MSESTKKSALVLHVPGGGEPLVYALSEETANDTAARVRDLMAAGSVHSLQLEDGTSAAINFAHVVSAHIDELPTLSHVYGSRTRSRGGFRA